MRYDLFILNSLKLCFPRFILYTFSHFCSVMMVWGLGFLVWVGFLGLAFQLINSVWGLLNKAVSLAIVFLENGKITALKIDQYNNIMI